ncbi:ribonuclease HI, partial [Campylobacter jejuni]|nr:ribonuclease HI [Campylobacter jejuni]MDQ6265017.1 ribonuclease HI [Campylobacter jejuni]
NERCDTLAREAALKIARENDEKH